MIATFAIFGPAVAVGVLLAVYGNDAAAAITSAEAELWLERAKPDIDGEARVLDEGAA